MKNVFLLLVVVLMALSCSPYKTMVDYDTTKDFSVYQTFNILKGKQQKVLVQYMPIELRIPLKTNWA
ncbi:hypothetical protein [Saccharicrinis sp. 156]|uniref:hypothetical protein n=1 Tax=Saccharicrinis sp. 156 TaxID=3417574 RepID=UPI003D357158